MLRTSIAQLRVAITRCPVVTQNGQAERCFARLPASTSTSLPVSLRSDQAQQFRTFTSSGSRRIPDRSSSDNSGEGSSSSGSSASPSTQELESNASLQPTTDASPSGSANVSDAMNRDLNAGANQEEQASTDSTSLPGTGGGPGREAPPTNLDDILGSISAVAMPGSSPASSSSSSDSFADESEGFRARSPTIRGSRYSPTLFSSSALPHRLYISTSRNNTILTLTSPTGDPLASASGGSVGFKKSARSGYEAGYRAAFSMFSKINDFKDAWRIMHLEVLWNGFGQGREAVYRALIAGEGQNTRNLISKMTDRTPIKVGGVRPKKRRML